MVVTNSLQSSCFVCTGIMLVQGMPTRDLHRTDVAGLKHGHRAVRGVRVGGDITGISVKPGTNVKLCKKMLRSHDRGIFFLHNRFRNRRHSGLVSCWKPMISCLGSLVEWSSQFSLLTYAGDLSNKTLSITINYGHLRQFQSIKPIQ